MAAPKSAIIARGVELIRQRLARGEPPQQRQTAELLGVDRVSLVRACARAGLVLPRGRPRKAPVEA